MPRLNLVNCWKPVRGNMTTTQLEMVNVNVRKHIAFGNQQPSAFKMVKVQRPGDIPHRLQVEPKRETGTFVLEDMVFSVRKRAAVTCSK